MSSKNRFLAFILIPWLFIPFAKAQEQALIVSLSNNPTWHKLIHYKQSSNGFFSEIKSDHFFNSKHGHSDPRHELSSFIHALNNQEKIHCKFPARYRWLNSYKELNLPPKDFSVCLDYQAWKSQNQAKSISLVFASGYLDNPASLYGHLILKLDKDKNFNNHLLDKSYNFGAMGTENSGAIEYILKGIFGGYDAIFSYAPFYKNEMLYGQHELRDLWIYQIDLAPVDVQRIQDHLWELKKAHFQYFFFKENCALQVADVIQLGLKEPLYNDKLPWVMPIHVVDHLVASNKVSQRHFIPSRQKKFYKTYAEYNEPQKQAFMIYVESNGDNIEPLLKLSQNERQPILNGLFDYYAYALGSTKQSPEYKTIKKKLLIAQLTHGKPGAQEFKFKEAPPELATNPSLISLGIRHQAKETSAIVRFRPAYFDSLNTNHGRGEFASLSMFEGRVKMSDQRFKIDELDIVKIVNLPSNSVTIKNDFEKAWTVNLGYRPNDNTTSSKHSLFAEGGVGLSYGKSDWLTYTLISASVNSTNNYRSHIYPNVGIIYKPSNGLRVRYSHGYSKGISSGAFDGQKIDLELSIPQSKDLEYRVQAQHHIKSSLQASINYYF